MHAVLRLARLTLVTCALVFAGTTAAHAAPPPPDSVWTQHYISEPGGIKLHADVLRPKHLPANRKTPVILSIGPYFNHSGQVGPLGPVEQTPYNPFTADGPSDRFYDYIEGAKVLQRGYTWVQVDLRGFGGSTGCLDWVGPGEQRDVKTAVEWAAKQSWSTGRVGMYGKSYDAVTGLVGVKQQPRGLRAVVAQEPVYDMYRYLYMNRTRYVNSLETPQLYNLISATPGPANDQLAYNLNSVVGTPPGCEAANAKAQQQQEHSAAYWKPRNLIAGLRGKKTPLFITQGLLENNTKPDGSAAAFNAVKGPKRAWIGMWDHVRGNERDPTTKRLLEGRKGWFSETMQWYDRFLKGKKAKKHYPKIVVETNDGKWRPETAWPARDAFRATAKLRTGSYSDDGLNNGSGDGGTPPYGLGIWTFSPRFRQEARISGTPKVSITTKNAKDRDNLYVDVYDVDAKNKATILSRGAYLLRKPGRVRFNLYDQDWVFDKGHRLGVLITGGQADWWSQPPTGDQVQVSKASLSLPYLACQRTQLTQGNPSVRLEDYKAVAPFSVSATTIKNDAMSAFPVPRKLAPCGKTDKLKRCVDHRRLTLKLGQPKHGRITKVTAFVNGKKVLARRGHQLRAVTIKRLPIGTFTVKFVAQSNSGERTVSVGRYRGCKKGTRTRRVVPAW